jgi:thiol-disulfide isomerase/thioredoxin
MSRFTGFLSALAVLLYSAAATGQDAAAQPSEKLAEGWRKGTQVSKAGNLCIAWVEQGWLQVKRQNAAGDLDWQIVLAKATDPTPPVIESSPETGKFALGYQNGRYFIRDFGFYLRCFREKKTADSPDWPRVTLPDEDHKSLGWVSGRSNWLTPWQGKSWFVVALGPAKDAFDCYLRLNHLELKGAGYGMQSNPEFVRAFHGETELIDEGDLLFCKRTPEAAAKAELALRAIKAKLLNSPAPDIDGQTWLNTSTPLPWKDLHGKVVLLDFWGTWCQPCIKKLPHTEELYQKYKDRGLVVIGVHSNNGAEDVESFLKEHKIHFPIVVDAGKTAEQYAIQAWPTYFLINREGQVVWGFENDAPTEKRIEALLKP